MKCLYCKKESIGKFCSKEHRLKHQDSVNDAIDAVSPILHSQDLTDKEKNMQDQFLKRRKSA